MQTGSLILHISLLLPTKYVGKFSANHNLSSVDLMTQHESHTVPILQFYTVCNILTACKSLTPH